MVCSITNKQKPAIIENVAKNQIKARINVIFVHEKFSGEKLRHLLLLSVNTTRVNKSKTVATRKRATRAALGIMDDALNRLINVLLECFTSHGARSGLTSVLAEASVG